MARTVQAVSMMANESMNKEGIILEQNLDQVMGLIHNAERMGLEYAPRVIGAILIYVIGRWVIHRMAMAFSLLFDKRRVDPSLKTFFVSFIRLGLMTLLFLAIIGLVGIPIAGFAAILAGLAFGIGSALNGSLGNVAGGIMILLTRPFGVGDLVKAGNEFGIVEEIGIIHTTLLTSQNMTVHLPNGGLSTGVIVNFTKQKNLRIDLPVLVHHGVDIDRARELAVAAMLSHPLVLKEPAPDIRVKAVERDGIKLVLWPRICVKAFDHANPRQMEADYYSVFYGVQEAVKKTFQQHGIADPYQQLDVTLKQ